jgi:hypothetical protein
VDLGCRLEPLLAGLQTIVATGERAAELALRFKYGGLDESRIVVEPSPRRQSITASP